MSIYIESGKYIFKYEHEVKTSEISGKTVYLYDFKQEIWVKRE